MKKTITTTLMAAAPVFGGVSLASAEDVETRIQRERDEVAAKLTSANPAVVTCAENANRQLDINDPHARRGYDNTAGWSFRNKIMNDFRTCAYNAEHSDNAGNNQALIVDATCDWRDLDGIATKADCEARANKCRRINNAWKYWDPLNTGIHVHRGSAETYRNTVIEPGYRACVAHMEQ